MGWNLRLGRNLKKVTVMNIGWTYKDGEVIEVPSFTAIIQRDEGWYVSTRPELGVVGQGKTRKEAYAMLAEAAELWLEAVSAEEIKLLAAQ